MNEEPIKIVFATQDDLVDLIIIGQEYFVESAYFGKRTPDWALYAHTIDQKIQANQIILAKDGDKIAGLAIMTLTYWLFPEGDLACDLFYVRKEYRGTVVGRAIRAGIHSIEAKIGPALTWEGSTSGFDDGGRNTQIYTNMLIKDGYTPLGMACVKIHEQGEKT